MFSSGGALISRYTGPEMGQIWPEENRFKTMLEVEIAACEAMAALKLIPKNSALNIRRRAKFNLSQIRKIQDFPKLTTRE